MKFSMEEEQTITRFLDCAMKTQTINTENDIHTTMQNDKEIEVIEEAEDATTLSSVDCFCLTMVYVY